MATSHDDDRVTMLEVLMCVLISVAGGMILSVVLALLALWVLVWGVGR
jgi:hypothetical protein